MTPSVLLSRFVAKLMSILWAFCHQKITTPAKPRSDRKYRDRKYEELGYGQDNVF